MFKVVVMSQKSPEHVTFNLKSEQRNTPPSVNKCENSFSELNSTFRGNEKQAKHFWFSVDPVKNRIYHADVVHIKCQEWAALPFKAPHQSTSKQTTQLNSHLLVQFQPCCPAATVLQVSTKNNHNDSRRLLTYSIISLLGLTSSLHLLSLVADNCPRLDLISSLCAFEWHKPNSLFVCTGC